MNLPRVVRFKRENVLIVGLIPGPREPSKTANTYLSPLISDLSSLWEGRVSFIDADSKRRIVRCAVIFVACDLPAARKVCRFLSYTANLGCSRCYKTFGTGTFGAQNYGGFDRSKWLARTNSKHRSDVRDINKCSTKTARTKKVSEVGCRYSCLLELPYFDVIQMLSIDPMHNLYLGTAKHIYLNVWLRLGKLDNSAIQTINSRIESFKVPDSIAYHELTLVNTQLSSGLYGLTTLLYFACMISCQMMSLSVGDILY